MLTVGLLYVSCSRVGRTCKCSKCRVSFLVHIMCKAFAVEAVLTVKARWLLSAPWLRPSASLTSSIQSVRIRRVDSSVDRPDCASSPGASLRSCLWEAHSSILAVVPPVGDRSIGLHLPDLRLGGIRIRRRRNVPSPTPGGTLCSDSRHDVAAPARLVGNGFEPRNVVVRPSGETSLRKCIRC